MLPTNLRKPESSEGETVLEATTTERVLSSWLIFFPIWIGFAFPLWVTDIKNTDWHVVDKLTMGIFPGFLILLTVLLYRSTAKPSTKARVMWLVFSVLWLAGVFSKRLGFRAPVDSIFILLANESP